MAGQAVFSVQPDRSEAYIAEPEHVEAKVEKRGIKIMQWKTKLIIAAVVVVLLIIAGLVVLAIIPHLYEDSVDFAKSRFDFRDTEDLPCENPPTGLMQLTTGVKILEVDTDPRSIEVSGDGQTVQLIALTCNEAKKFVDQDEKEWDVPDQVAFIENLYIGEASGSTSIFRRTEELDSERSLRLGLRVGKSSLFRMIFSRVKKFGSWKYYSDQITESDEKIVKTSIFFGSYKVVFKSFGGLRFESTVLKSFENLQDCYSKEELLDPEECKNRYKNFIDFHGTHYYTQASLGGRTWSYYEVSSTYMEANTEQEIKARAQYSFWRKTGYTAVSVNNTASAEEFERNSQYKISYKGGKAEYYRKDTFEDWRDSIFSYPAKYDHELAPIYFLVDETDPRRQIMEEVFEEYIMEEE